MITYASVTETKCLVHTQNNVDLKYLLHKVAFLIITDLKTWHVLVCSECSEVLKLLRLQ